LRCKLSKPAAVVADEGSANPDNDNLPPARMTGNERQEK
jgi:hypothetical protein